MFLVQHFDLSLDEFESEQSNHVIAHELCSYRTANKIRILLVAQCHVLLDLNDVQFVSAALCLNGNDVLAAFCVYTYKQLVRFNLSDAFDSGTKVILQLIASDSGEDVNQPVVPDF